MENPMTPTSQRRVDVAGLVIALILLVLAGLVWWDMTKLQILSPYDLGPKVMPVIVYLLFGKLLTLGLPAGPLENLF